MEGRALVKFGACLSLEPRWGEISRAGEYARQLEQLGYDYIWCSDERFERDVFTVLALAALSTKNVRLGTCATNPYMRHPLTTAAAISTINELSGGRAVLGISAGGSSLFEQQQMERPHSPLLALREAIEVVGAMSKGEKFDYEGKTMKFRGANLDFDSRHVPIYLAGRGPKLFQLAGELADGVIIGSLASKSGIRFALENLKNGAHKSGRDVGDIDVVFWAYAALSDDEEKAKQLVKRIIVSSMWSSKSILKYLGIDDDVWRPIEDRLKIALSSGLRTEDAYRQAYDRVTDDILDAWSVTGNIESVVRKARAIMDEGVNQFAVLPFGETQAERRAMLVAFAEEVIPKLKEE
jgi:5,10-methylenetetrahydromethanopterin reductase